MFHIDRAPVESQYGKGEGWARGRLPVPADHDVPPLEPLSPHSTSRLARQADTGLAHHKALRIDDLVAVLNADQPAAAPAPVVAPVWDWAAANQRKKDAVQQLAPLADALNDIEARIDKLITRTKGLQLA